MSQGNLNILQMAEQIAKNIPDSEKKEMENMDMEKMLGMLSKNVFSQLQGIDKPEQMASPPPAPASTKRKKRKKKKPKRTKDLNCQMEVSLKDLYCGKTKKIMIPRQNFNDDGEFTEKKQFNIDIKPGTPDQYVITLEGEGDRVKGHVSGDINIIICQKDHDVFDRDEANNLFMTQPISISEVYFLDYKFKHLDGRIIQVEPLYNDGDLQNENMKKLPNEGFVDLETGEKGDLFIRFEMHLPPAMAEEHMEKLKELFPPEANKLEEEADVTLKLETMSEEDFDSDDTSDDSELYSDEEVYLEEGDVLSDSGEEEVSPS